MSIPDDTSRNAAQGNNIPSLKNSCRSNERIVGPYPPGLGSVHTKSPADGTTSKGKSTPARKPMSPAKEHILGPDPPGFGSVHVKSPGDGPIYGTLKGFGTPVYAVYTVCCFDN